MYAFKLITFDEAPGLGVWVTFLKQWRFANALWTLSIVWIKKIMVCDVSEAVSALGLTQPHTHLLSRAIQGINRPKRKAELSVYFCGL
jgi:hypothetical protein